MKSYNDWGVDICREWKYIATPVSNPVGELVDAHGPGRSAGVVGDRGLDVLLECSEPATSKKVPRDSHSHAETKTLQV